MKYVLSIDSGGIRGVVAAQFLLRLEEFLMKTKKKHINEIFDMFLGTSIGGLLALGLGSGSDFSEFDKIFSLKNMKLVLGEQSYTSSIASTIYPKRDGDGINKVVSEYLPDIKLNEYQTRTLIISYNLDEYKTVIYKSRKHDINVQKLARLTTAAPSYFPCVQCPDGMWHLDGGVGVTNPSMVAHIEAKKTWTDGKYGDIKDEYKILSVGTGYKNIKIDGKQAKSWGFVKWMLNDLFHVLTDAPYRVVSEQCQQLLGKNYLRIDSELTGASYDMDNTSKSNYLKLKQLGDQWFEDNIDKIVEFFGIKSKL